MWSYCNSSFVVAGHVVEKLTGLPYHRALRERVCEPLGLSSVTVLAEEMLARRCAVGHVLRPDQVAVLPPVIIMGMAGAPAGSRAVATAADLAAFTRAHLRAARGAV
jgi:CubicO group peptidase (beta-lactamase class C family)